MTAAACPACASLPEPKAARGEVTHVLHLPGIHCAGCISGVEGALGALPGVASARVNLSRRRVALSAPGVSFETLIGALGAAGYRAQRMDAGRLAGDGAGRDLLTRIGVSGFALMNVMLLSVAVWSGATGVTAQAFHLISAMIAIPAVIYAAQPFFGSALGALRARRLNMDVPISLAIVLASAASFASVLGFSDRAGWFDAALALTFFLLVGRYLDHAGRAAARSAAAELAALEVPQAVLTSGRVVAAGELMPGDRIRVLPGDRLPADGTIASGRSDLDRSALTGESAPEAAGPGDAVAAGEISLTGTLEVVVTRAGADTGLARMAELVATAEAQRTRYAGIADRAARIYAPAVHLLGAAAFLGWLAATGDGWRALDVAISVLVITCPCALGLAVPAVSTVATGRLYRAGVLVTSPTALERLSQVETVAFDKTGTLTGGRAADVSALPEEALAVAAGLAAGSRHPVARAVAEAADRAEEVTQVVEHPGLGLEGLWRGGRVRLGRPGWAGPEGGASVWLSLPGRAPMALKAGEAMQDGAAEAARELRSAGYGTALLSGDAGEPVARAAEAAGIAEAHARMTPEEKLAWVRGRGHVLMVGDGLNDTGSLAAAHASMAPGTALNAARSAADVVLLSGGLSGVPRTLRLAREAMGRMRQNIGLAVLYNAVSIPVALSGHATPFLAALAMSLSSLTVTLNATRPFR